MPPNRLTRILHKSTCPTPNHRTHNKAVPFVGLYVFKGTISSDIVAQVMIFPSHSLFISTIKYGFLSLPHVGFLSSSQPPPVPSPLCSVVHVISHSCQLVCLNSFLSSPSLGILVPYCQRGSFKNQCMATSSTKLY